MVMASVVGTEGRRRSLKMRQLRDGKVRNRVSIGAPKAGGALGGPGEQRAMGQVRGQCPGNGGGGAGAACTAVWEGPVLVGQQGRPFIGETERRPALPEPPDGVPLGSAPAPLVSWRAESGSGRLDVGQQRDPACTHV